MKKQHVKKFIGAMVACTLIGLTATSFRGTSLVQISTTPPDVRIDTPKKQARTPAEFKALNDALDNLKAELRQINWDSLSKSIQECVSSIDMAKVQSDIANSLKEIDLDKIKIEINNASKAVDVEKLNADIRKAAAEIKANINSKEFKKTMKDAEKKYKKEMEKSRLEMERLKRELKLQLEKNKSVTTFNNGNR